MRQTLRAKQETLGMAEAAHMLAVSRAACETLVLKQLLPASKIGGRWRIDAQAVRALRAERASSARSAA